MCIQAWAPASLHTRPSPLTFNPAPAPPRPVPPTLLLLQHTIFGEVAEGMEVLDALNDAPTDEAGRPLQNIRIRHTLVLDDPTPDPRGLEDHVPESSPAPQVGLAGVGLGWAEDAAGGECGGWGVGAAGKCRGREFGSVSARFSLDAPSPTLSPPTTPPKSAVC